MNFQPKNQSMKSIEGSLFVMQSYTHYYHDKQNITSNESELRYLIHIHIPIFLN